MVVQQLNESSREMSEKSNELVVLKKAGGSVIEQPVVFSRDEKNLYVVWGSNVRSYNVETGELVTVYEGLSEDAVGVCLDPGGSNKLIAVSCEGELAEWDAESRESFIRKTQLGKESEKLKILSFSVIQLEDDERQCIVCIASVEGRNWSQVRTFCAVTGQERNFFQRIRVESHNHCLSVRQNNGETLLAAFCNKPKNTLTICVKYEGSQMKTMEAYPENRMTCIACHPTELCVITGDIIGCIRVWKNLLIKPVWAPYHWHTLPVQSLVFSQSGSYFFSGGDECVLVRWLSESSNHNRFLPRLPAEIAHISVSPENTWTAVSTRDNAIQLVNSSLNVVRSIQHFSWSSFPSNEKYLSPVVMTNDPRTKALVINGRVGHIQFFSVEQDNLMYLLDVVCRNYLTQERSKTIKNTEVVKFSFSDDGTWLATVEFCEEEGNAPIELRLKFWEFNKVKQQYVLNTSVERPHRGKVQALQFRPTTSAENLMCVTTGEDLKFRTWVLEESTSIYRKGHVWNSENVGFYRNLPVGALSFSSDGSLMAVAFGATLTVWVPGTNQIKCSLTRPDTKEYLSHVEFGRKQCVHLVVTGSSVGIAVWNLLSLSLLWIVRFKLSLLVSDPVSNIMAAFSDRNDIVVFSPDSPEPVFKQDSLAPSEKTKFVSAVFVPHTRQNNNLVSWQSMSQLYFFNTKQELLCLEDPSAGEGRRAGGDLDVVPTQTYKPKTAYAALLAQESRSDVADVKKEQHKHMGIPGYRSLRELLESPAHAMPPMSLLGYPVLLSFISKREQSGDVRHPKLPVPGKKLENDDDDDSGMEDREEPPTTALSFEERKRDLMNKKQYSETSANTADIDKRLTLIQRKSLDWVSELLK